MTENHCFIDSLRNLEGGGYFRNFLGGDVPEPLTYTRASSAKFCYPYTRVNSSNPPILE